MGVRMESGTISGTIPRKVEAPFSALFLSGEIGSRRMAWRDPLEMEGLSLRRVAIIYTFLWLALGLLALLPYIVGAPARARGAGRP